MSKVCQLSLTCLLGHLRTECTVTVLGLSLLIYIVGRNLGVGTDRLEDIFESGAEHK